MKKLIYPGCDFEKAYKNLLNKILSKGGRKNNRTGVDAFSLFSENLKIKVGVGDDINDSIVPLITGKKIFANKAFAEFEWIYNGRSNVNFLIRRNVKWWNEYADKDGYVNFSYGHQLRHYNWNTDQLRLVIKELKNKSRRAHITFWNPSELHKQKLPCCYTGMTFYISDENVLSMQMQFRSSDAFLGLPYDFLIGYFFLINIAKEINCKLGCIDYVMADIHVYDNHVDAVREYLTTKTYGPVTYAQLIQGDYKQGDLIRAKLNN